MTTDIPLKGETYVMYIFTDNKFCYLPMVYKGSSFNDSMGRELYCFCDKYGSNAEYTLSTCQQYLYEWRFRGQAFIDAILDDADIIKIRKVREKYPECFI